MVKVQIKSEKLTSFGGDGISTVCASATPLGLTLAPD